LKVQRDLRNFRPFRAITPPHPAGGLQVRATSLAARPDASDG
jgi:hypothetical protein